MTNVHWTVATNYRLRTGSFALMFASIACTLNITISRGLKGMLQSQLAFVTRNRLAGNTVVLAGQYCLHGFHRSCGLWPKRAIAQDTRRFAFERANRWRTSVAESTLVLDGVSVKITASIGVAIYPLHGETMEELTRCADLALYRAKQERRNRVVMFAA